MPGPYAAARRRARCVVSGASSHRISGNLMRWCAAEASRWGLTCASGSAGVRERASSFPEWAVGFGALGVVAGPEVGQGDAATQPGQLHRQPRAPTGIGRSGERPPPSLRWPHARFRTRGRRRARRPGSEFCGKFVLSEQCAVQLSQCWLVVMDTLLPPTHAIAATSRIEARFVGAAGELQRLPWLHVAQALALEELRPVRMFPVRRGRRVAPGWWWSATSGQLGALRVRGDAHASHAAGP